MRIPLTIAVYPLSFQRYKRVSSCILEEEEVTKAIISPAVSDLSGFINRAKFNVDRLSQHARQGNAVLMTISFSYRKG
jgi:hypothetical protein